MKTGYPSPSTVGTKWLVGTVVEKFTVQKTYNRYAFVGIFGNLALCGISNLRVFNILSGFDPDQVHHIFNNLRLSPLPVWAHLGANSKNTHLIAT